MFSKTKHQTFPHQGLFIKPVSTHLVFLTLYHPGTRISSSPENRKDQHFETTVLGSFLRLYLKSYTE